MTYFTTELQSILIFLCCSVVLSIVLFILVYLMSFNSKVEFEKSSAYECGFALFAEPQTEFTVQYSLIALMFLLFDIEVLYLYPLVQSAANLSFLHFVILAIFFVVLSVGIVYEISRQVMSMTEIPNKAWPQIVSH